MKGASKKAMANLGVSLFVQWSSWRFSNRSTCYSSSSNSFKLHTSR